MAVVYQHRRKDTNEVFYIGIGKTKQRVMSNINRNKHWHNIVNKYGYEADVLFEGISWEDACNVEIGMIECYGRRDLKLGNLVNLTDGGEGRVNVIVSEETKVKIGIASRNISDETRKKMSNSKKNISDETRKKMSIAKKGIIPSEETRKKISESGFKKIIDKETNVIYNSIYDAAKTFNLNYNTLCAMLRGYVKNKTNLDYLNK
jgi:hypothetical protein